MVARHLQPQKFVAALPRQKFALRQHAAHAVCGLDQQQVAGGMAEHVVDVLEAVDVDGEGGELVRLLMGLGGVESEAFVERDAVRQARHAVVERELMDAVGRFRARAQIDDIGRKARAHHQQHRADHGNAQRRRRDQPGLQGRSRIRRDGGRRNQGVVQGADHEGEHDRGAVTAPSRHRTVGSVNRERAEPEAEQEGQHQAVRVPVHRARDMPALHGDKMHGEDADAHDKAAGFRRQREMAAADRKADEAGDDGDDQHERRLRPARSRSPAAGRAREWR